MLNVLQKALSPVGETWGHTVGINPVKRVAGGDDFLVFANCCAARLSVALCREDSTRFVY
jgi:hypothetical protein